MSELNYHISMKEIRSNHIRDKRCAFILENDGYNIIPNVTLPLKLKRKEIMKREGRWKRAEQYDGTSNTSLPNISKPSVHQTPHHYFCHYSSHNSQYHTVSHSPLYAVLQIALLSQPRCCNLHSSFWYLLGISLCEGQLCGHVKHDLLPPEICIDWLGACLTSGNIQASPEPEQIHTTPQVRQCRNERAERRQTVWVTVLHQDYQRWFLANQW